MPKNYDWRIADWTNKNDETVGESKFVISSNEEDSLYATKDSRAVPFLDFEKPFQAYLKNVINFNEKQDRRHCVINLKGTQ